MRALFVHGGVSGRSSVSPHLDVTSNLQSWSVAVDAVEESVRRLEDHPQLNAGHGAVLNRAGEIELDAGIADGHSGRFGGVVSVSVRHPISLARHVMQDTPHVLMSGLGAMGLAGSFGLEGLDRTTEAQTNRWRSAVAKAEGFRFAAFEEVDTVGAVGLDEEGRLSAASSSGGLFGKLPGRVGDSAIYGAGFFANKWAAVTGTGVGEFFIEESACRRVAEMIEGGVPAQAAVGKVSGDLVARGSPAAILALTRRGEVAAAYSGLSWAVEGFGAELEVQKLSPHPTGARDEM